MPVLIAHSYFYLIVFYVALFVCFAPDLFGSFFRKPEKGATRRDRGSHAVIFIAIGVGMAVAFSFTFGVPATTIAWHQRLVFWIGIAIMLCGLAFRWYAIKVLGKFFTRDVATRAGQYLVQTGPYRLIRHPSYSGAMLMFLGTGLAMTDWVSLVCVILGAGIGYGYRVHVEERVLCAHLGEPYRDYMQRTRRFVPYVW